MKKFENNKSFRELSRSLNKYSEYIMRLTRQILNANLTASK